MLLFSGVREQKGFVLTENFRCENNLVVLTGKNGAGKTRFLEAVENGAILTARDGDSIEVGSIKLLRLSALIPNFGSSMGDAYYQSRASQTAAYFESSRDKFNSPFDPVHDIVPHHRMGMAQATALGYRDLHNLCRRIAMKLEKSVEDIHSIDVMNFFEEPSAEVFGIRDFSSSCNAYVRKKHQNLYSMWRATVIKDKVSYVSPERFVERFGEGPWVSINKVLSSVFEGKFYFKAPDENSFVYNYVAELRDIKTDGKLEIADLSSGEQTLLWLALTLYNTQYCVSESEMVPKLLLLDEPDSFLHPKMVVKLYDVLHDFISVFKSSVLITTHSPTTVALAPEKSVSMVGGDGLSLVEKDAAIAELLDGITQVSIDPDNRREVFVENLVDAKIYEMMFDYFRGYSKDIDPKISLSFVPSGPKLSIDTLAKNIKLVFGIDDEGKILELYELVNGGGDYGQVTGYVESLQSKGSRTVRGIVDWDLVNKPKKGVVVHACEYAYTLENVLLDPICIMYMLHAENPAKYTMISYCGESVRVEDWLEDDGLLQKSIDRFVRNVIGDADAGSAELVYASGRKLNIDSRYLLVDGHHLKNLIIQKHNELSRFDRRNGGLLIELAKTMTMKVGKGFIPKSIEGALAELQR
jgi:ABC-type branched-subunit amino acid transport system ATPase component